MEFLKKYFYGILTPAEEAWVQDWLVRHMDEPQVQQTLMDIMDDMEEEDRVLSSAAFSEVCRKLGLERKLRRRMLYRKIGLTALKAAACLLLFVAGAAARCFLSGAASTRCRRTGTAVVSGGSAPAADQGLCKRPGTG